MYIRNGIWKEYSSACRSRNPIQGETGHIWWNLQNQKYNYSTAHKHDTFEMWFPIFLPDNYYHSSVHLHLGNKYPSRPSFFYSYFWKVFAIQSPNVLAFADKDNRYERTVDRQSNDPTIKSNLYREWNFAAQIGASEQNRAFQTRCISIFLRQRLVVPRITDLILVLAMVSVLYTNESLLCMQEIKRNVSRMWFSEATNYFDWTCSVLVFCLFSRNIFCCLAEFNQKQNECADCHLRTTNVFL